MTLQAFEAIINITLYHQMGQLIMETQAGIEDNNILSIFEIEEHYASMQEQYSLAYPGEVLERYEERCGKEIRNTRALALALAKYNRALTKEMFVSNQYNRFLKHIQDTDDIYLKGALYHLKEKEREPIKQYFLSFPYSKTEEIIFALNILEESEAWEALSPIVVRLLGKERTHTAYGNSRIYGWLTEQYGETIRTDRKKSLKLLKAVMELSRKYCKEGSPAWDRLINNGYSPQEIQYLNLKLPGIVNGCSDTLKKYSITMERMALEAAVSLINAEQIEDPHLYELLEQLLQDYQKYVIKLDQCEGIIKSMEHRVHINAATMFQFLYERKEKYHFPISFFYINIGNENKWDTLINWMEPREYRAVFQDSLCFFGSEETCDIAAWLQKYQALTGQNYLDAIWEENDIGIQKTFRLLVKKNVFDLVPLVSQYKCDQTRMGESERKEKWKEMLPNLKRVIRVFDNYNVFRFLDAFADQFGILTLDSLLEDKYDHLLLDAVNIRTYGNRFQNMKLLKEFLSKEEQGRLLTWVEQTVFAYMPDDHETFLVALLTDEKIKKQFPQECRELFFDLEKNGFLMKDHIYGSYLTEEEYQEYKRRKKEKAEKEKKEYEQKKSETLHKELDRELQKAVLPSEKLEIIASYYTKYSYDKNALEVINKELSGLLNSGNNSYPAIVLYKIVLALTKQGLDFSVFKELINHMEVEG